MPQMGFDMKEGTVVRWLLTEGSDVKVGDPVAEIETDKAVVEFESTASGVLRKVLVPEGSTVSVGESIAIVGSADEELPSIETKIVDSSDEVPDSSIDIIAPQSPDEARQEIPESDLVEEIHEVRASPVAKRLADEKGIDLSKVEGTGPGQRITKADLLAYESSMPKDLSVSTPKLVQVSGTDDVGSDKQPLSKMRNQIARVTVKSKQETPHFYVSADINMTWAMQMRQQINGDSIPGIAKVSVNDLIIKACVEALKKYPKFNASFVDDSIKMNKGINVGIAIAEDEGLILPAIIGCERQSLLEIAQSSKDLIERSKSGTLRPEEYTGGTFSISNLGMFDVSSFIAIILPPQSAVLAVGTVSKKPVVIDEQVNVADMMTATLSVDHRISDGAEGARFLVEVKRLLENPLSLVM